MNELKMVPGTIQVDDSRDVARLLQETFAEGDVDAVVRIYTDNAVMVTRPGEAVTGSAAIRQVVEMWLGAGASFTWKVNSLHQAEDVALEVLEWRLDGAPFPDIPASGLAVLVLRRQADGTWRVQIDNAFVLD